MKSSLSFGRYPNTSVVYAYGSEVVDHTIANILQEYSVNVFKMRCLSRDAAKGNEQDDADKFMATIAMLTMITIVSNTICISKSGVNRSATPPILEVASNDLSLRHTYAYRKFMEEKSRRS